MTTQPLDTEQLLHLATGGDLSARQQLLTRHRQRLRQMVAVRLDRRLISRIDPSDVVQETLLVAEKKLDKYLIQRPVSFYPWLRRLAWEQLIKLNDKHIRARKRTVLMEDAGILALPEDSAVLLARRLAGSGTSPSHGLVRNEQRNRVWQALEKLPSGDREVLVLRYLEQLSTVDIAAVLDVSESAVKMRHRRALNRLSRLLSEHTAGDDS